MEIKGDNFSVSDLGTIFFQGQKIGTIELKSVSRDRKYLEFVVRGFNTDTPDGDTVFMSTIAAGGVERTIRD